jgi:hypothetical protein
MNKSIAICGDSFNIGIGCRDLENEPYGSLLAKELNRPLINLAKGSSTNLSIYLQAKHVVDDLLDKTEYVIVSHTSYDRVDWFPIDVALPHELSNYDVNYHQYPPYGPNTYITQIDHPMKDDPKYKGTMFTENFRGIIDYWETFKSKNKETSYYARFDNEPIERSKVLYDFARMIHENSIDRIKSIGLMTMAHQLLKRANVKHLILTHEVEYYNKFIDIQNLVNLSWGKLSNDYPDDLPSLHTSSEGHVVAFNIIMAKFKENQWV